MIGKGATRRGWLVIRAARGKKGTMVRAWEDEDIRWQLGEREAKKLCLIACERPAASSRSPPCRCFPATPCPVTLDFRALDFCNVVERLHAKPAIKRRSASSAGGNDHEILATETEGI